MRLLTLSGLLLAALLPAVSAAPILVIGDSLTKEYQITFPGVPLAGVPGIDAGNPQARNWSEILSARRNTHFDQGQFKNSLFSPWKDLRLLGHEYNWAVPGAKARHLRNLLLMQNTGELSADEDFQQLTDLAPEWQQSPARITAQLQSGAGGVVILIGGNDLRSGSPDPAASVDGTPVTYGTIYAGDGTGAGNPQPLMNSIRDSVQAIAGFVRTANPGIPLAICAVPHIGCTPDVMAGYPTDPVRTARITTALDGLNAELKTWTESTAQAVWVPETYTLTKALINAPPHIGGVSFSSGPDPLGSGDAAALHNRYLFAADGFHPTTALHALVARAVLSAFKAAFPGAYGTLPSLETREILVDVLGLSPSTGFTEFLASAGVPAGARGALEDPDGDGMPNLTEYALAGPAPATPDRFPAIPFALGSFQDLPAATLSWTPRFADNAACTILCQASTDLAGWTDIPATQVVTDPVTGTRTAHFPVNPQQKAFLRLKITATP